MRTSILLIVALSLGVVHDGQSQDRAFVNMETNFPEAVLYADSVRIGSTFGEAIGVPATARTLRLVPPDVSTWTIAPVSKNVDLVAGDTLDLQLDFPYYYRIESVPFDAIVHIEDAGSMKRIGSTPLLYSSQKPIQGNFVIERAGYAIERVNPGREVWNRHIVELSPSDDLDPAEAQVSWKPPKKHRTWIDYAALGAAVAAGAVAVHYKFKADDLYAEYEETADPALRDDIKAYDVRSGVALGVMQAGIGVFAIRLALR